MPGGSVAEQEVEKPNPNLTSKDIMIRTALYAIGASLLGLGTLHADLVIHWQLEEGASDPFASTTFSAVGGFSGELTSGTFFPTWETSDLAPVPPSEGGTQAAVRFDATDAGIDPYISTDASGVLGGAARTFAAWIKASANQPNFATFLAYGNNGTGQAIRFRLDPSGFLRLEYSGSAALGSTRRLNDDQWHHVAATLPDNATAGDTVFYIDGNVEPTKVTNPGRVLNTTEGNMHPMTIGNSRHSLGNYGFNGVVDDLRIYDTQLTQAEIQALVFGAGNPPAIDKQPVAQKAILGGTNEMVTFSVDVSGSPPLAFQWKHDGVDVPGGTGQNLVIGPVTVDDLGSYSVAISNDFGFALSTPATLSWGTPAVNPSEQTVVLGRNGSFDITMPADSSGYTYQWKKDGIALSGATESGHAILNAASDDAGEYTVEVSLAGQSAVSDPAQLRVVAAPASPYARLVMEDGPAAYWRLNETTGATVARDVTTFHPGMYVNAANMEQPGAITGDADPAVDFYSGGNGYVEVPASMPLNRTNSFSVEAWAKPADAVGRQSVVASRTSTRTRGYELVAVGSTWQFRSGASDDATSFRYDDLNGGTVTPNEWHHVVATYDGSVKRLYVNGVLVGETNNVIWASETVLRVGADQTFSATPGDFFAGVLDEVAVYWRTLTPEQVADHYLAGTFGAGIPPTLTSEPQNTHIVLGDSKATATFNVTAAGSPRLKYQWKKDGADLPGATRPTLVLSPATGADLGTYAVAVSNEVGGVVSSEVTLTYGTGPVVPVAQVALSGGSVTFTLTGMPDGQAYSYQWKKEGSVLAGQTEAKLILPNVNSSDAGSYSVEVTLDGTTVESDAVTLTVLPAPTTTYADAVQTDAPIGWYRLGDTAGFGSAADASGNFRDGVALTDVHMEQEGAILGDADTAALFTGYTPAARGLNSKIDAVHAELNTPLFSVECWALARGAAGSTRTVLSTSAGTDGTDQGYDLVLGDDDAWRFDLGTGSSGVTTLPGPPAVIGEWTHLMATYDGATARFYVNGALVSTASTAFAPNDGSVGASMLRIGAMDTVSEGQAFFVGLIDEVSVYSTALSDARVQAHYAAAFQNAPARFPVAPLSRAFMAGSDLELSASVHSAPPYSLQWKHNGVAIPDATAETLIISPVTEGDAGDYVLSVTNPSGTTDSPAATVEVFPGVVTSTRLMGFATGGTMLIENNGGLAGYVRVGNWNEIGLNQASGSQTGLMDDHGNSNDIIVSWAASTTRRYNGPFNNPAGDFALLNGFLDSQTETISLTISNVPAAYQSEGYDLYLYMGAPYAGVGTVEPFVNFYGTVSVGTSTNYYHGIDLATWDGRFASSTTADEFSVPEDGNYAVFKGLSAPTVEIVAAPHSTYPGPATLSGFQIVSAALPPGMLYISRQNGEVVVEWDGNRILQVAPTASGPYSDVVGATSPYPVPTPLAAEQYFRLRNP